MNPNSRPDGASGGDSYFPIQTPMVQYAMPYILNTPMSQARVLEDLFTERSYLLNSLQHENSKATDLLARLTSAQANLDSEGTPNVRRKIRKQLGWLKRRLDETNRQEKTLLAHLGQLNYQIQSIERWSQIENQRQVLLQQQQLFYTPLPIHYSMPQMMLSPMSPEFQPQEHHIPSPQWLHIEWPQQHHPAEKGEPTFRMPFENYSSDLRTRSHGDNGSVSPKCTEVMEKSAVGAEARKRPPFVTRSSSLNGTELDVLSTGGTLQVPGPVIKRHSMSMIPRHSDMANYSRGHWRSRDD